MKEDFLKALKEMDNYTYTENGAVAYRSTGNKVLDAFGTLGAMMTSEPEDILNTFYGAFYEDKELAMRLLFYMRDIRGGQGMRRVFRIISRNLAITNPDMVINNLDNFLFYGRGDDFYCLVDTPVEEKMFEYINQTLKEDLDAVANGNGCSLLGKWLKSENTSSPESVYLARKTRKALGMNPKDYRQMLSLLRREIDIVESKMSQNKWDEINFEKLPSKAAMIYSDAFMKHVETEYIKYLTDLSEGKVKINANALFPVDIIKQVIENYRPSVKDYYLYDAMWKALPNYFGDSEETGICVVDVSGSMLGTPMNVAISLGMYCADKCKGPFKNNFITFSAEPKLQEIVGDNIFEKVRNMERAAWDMNTNLEKVFELILDSAKEYNLKQEDLPSKLYIISDMQFDAATTDYYGSKKKITFMDIMKSKFAAEGYTMPAIVYWNVRASNCGMFQQKVDGEDCCMVSGYSPSLFEAVIKGTEYVEEVTEKGETVVKQKIDPITVMKKTLMSERYDRVYVG